MQQLIDFQLLPRYMSQLTEDNSFWFSILGVALLEQGRSFSIQPLHTFGHKNFLVTRSAFGFRVPPSFRSVFGVEPSPRAATSVALRVRENKHMAHIVETPPPTAIEPITEVLHGVEVTDPYRWLEDQNSPRTRKWIEQQGAYTAAYFAALPDRERIKTRVRELLAFKEVISEPWNVGDRYFFLKRRDDGEQPVIVMREGPTGAERILVDPAERGSGESTSVGIVAISEDTRLLAYSVREGGTDHSALEILDIESGNVLPDSLPEGFCTGLVFAPDGSGFYYSHRELKDSRPNYRAVCWHKFGTELGQDSEIFFAGNEPNLFLGILHSPEAQLLAYVVFFTGKVQRTSLYLQELPSQPNTPHVLLRDIQGSFVPFFVRGQLLAYTDFGALNFRIVRIDPANPEPSCWRDVVPESDRRIQQFAVASRQVFVTRIDRFSTSIDAFSLDGERKEAIASPPNATIDFLNRTTASKRLFYSQTSISNPATIYWYEPRKKQASAWEASGVQPNLPIIAVEEVEFTSKNGAAIPLFLAVRKDLLCSGPLPTFLTGYGGFGSFVTPRFTAFSTFLIEQGFLFAVPALRGGSELGEQWHRAGKRELRQNSFDDFIYAAEWLIDNGRSIAGKIAIGGGSNAGLLVGAAITQHPALFCAAICLGPLLDMTRYHLFDFASGWADEYGSPADDQDFGSLLAYSPYHRVQEGVEYPAILLISGDADTRCNPMHTRKMTARLQAANLSDRPILLDYKTSWGHTPVQPLSTKIKALTDRLAFVCHELRVPVQQRGAE
jgi:prolyl oligopeptidase